MNAETFKNWADGIQAVAGTLAIGIGAWWTWAAFVRGRTQYPRASVEHTVAHRQLPHQKVLLRVSLHISNCGGVVLPVRSTLVRVQRVLPLPPHVEARLTSGKKVVPDQQTSVDWELLDDQRRAWQPGEHELEPGEHENWDFDFVVGADVSVVQVYAYVQNTTKRGREIGWGSATLYSLEESHETARLKQ